MDGPEEDTGKPLPLCALLTRPVVVSVANYGTIGLLEITAAALIPLIWSTSIELGELGLSPASVGLLMAEYAVGFLTASFNSSPSRPWSGVSAHGVLSLSSAFSVFYKVYVCEKTRRAICGAWKYQ